MMEYKKFCLIITIIQCCYSFELYNGPKLYREHRIQKRQSNGKCSADQFHCDDACLNRTSTCDGFFDCADESDESWETCHDRTCSSNRFRCQSGGCIHKNKLCDGFLSCIKGDDETVEICKNNVCPPEKFRCSYGGCIRKKKVCDGSQDCSDGSDESPALCSKDTIVTSKPTSSPVTTKTIISDVKQCILPPITPDKTYTIACSVKNGCGTKPGEKVTEFTVLSSRCNPGYTLYEDGKINMISNCFNGNWSSVVKCKNVRGVAFVASVTIKLAVTLWTSYMTSSVESENVPRLKSENVQESKIKFSFTIGEICKDISSLDLDLTCSQYLHGPRVPCTGTLLEGAAVVPRCKSQYHINYPVSYRHVTCQKDGNWNKEFFECSPTCGKSTSSVVELIVHAKKGNPKDVPWNVAIYSSEISKEPQFICGGTLISEVLVVSAAHCFVDQSTQRKLDARFFTIIVGKSTVDFNKKDSNSTRKLSVKSIYFADTPFDGEKTGYESDIAILLLSDKITFSDDVLPACIRLNEKGRFFPSGKVTFGKLSGFGATEREDISSVLRTANLPYIEFAECKRRVSEDFKYSISFDKFCAGNETGSGARVGDSGGGLVFMDEKDGFFYLRGVVSNRERGESSIAAFTDIGFHMDWLKKIVSNVGKTALKDDTQIDVKSKR